MLNENNQYTKMQRDYYDATADIMAIENHRGHDANPDYYGLLLSDVSKKYSRKKALDFGCGVGRNIDNLLNLVKWSKVDGCDISHENIVRAKAFMSTTNHSEDKYNFYITNGVNLSPLKSNYYDFVMSTIVLQHISVYSIRYSILSDIYRVMKQDGLFTFQMSCHGPVSYYDEDLNIQATNGAYDVAVSDPQNLIDDLEKIGFSNISYTISTEWNAAAEQYFDESRKWIYVKAYKCS